MNAWLPIDFLKTVLIQFPKKTGNRKQLAQYHMLLRFCRVSNQRRKSTVEENSGEGEEQSGFRSMKGTRGLLKMIGERGKKISMCLVALEKTFDWVNWEKIAKILKAKRMDWKNRRMIRDLFKSEGSSEDKWVYKWMGGVGRGVRQGCCLSSCLISTLKIF